ncbi:hypothetical protein HK102_011595 [Quaeritorhiza haematococci]|nr:hypothetical protein HK102_011595 [Quaeritorhiza haematococci]
MPVPDALDNIGQYALSGKRKSRFEDEMLSYRSNKKLHLNDDQSSLLSNETWSNAQSILEYQQELRLDTSMNDHFSHAEDSTPTAPQVVVTAPESTGPGRRHPDTPRPPQSSSQAIKHDHEMVTQQRHRANLLGTFSEAEDQEDNSSVDEFSAERIRDTDCGDYASGENPLAGGRWVGNDMSEDCAMCDMDEATTPKTEQDDSMAATGALEEPESPGTSFINRQARLLEASIAEMRAWETYSQQYFDDEEDPWGVRYQTMDAYSRGGMPSTKWWNDYSEQLKYQQRAVDNEMDYMAL